MRIESIRIQNMRQMKDLSLSFSKDDNKNDLHVILAENGVGKTNIVNALTWCLYNKETHLRDEQTALSIVNNQLINETRQRGGGPVEVKVSLVIKTDDDIDWIEFSRVGKYNITTDAIIPISDDLKITLQENGGYRIIDNLEETAQIIHQYLPEEINNYIFFDGEQLESFFSQDQIEKVQDGISQLTQASYLEKAANYLNNYIEKEIVSRYKEANDEELNKQQKLVHGLEDTIQTNKDTIDNYKTQITNCTNRINELNNIIKGFETIKDKVEELNQLETEVTVLRAEHAEKQKEIISFCKKYYILLSFYPSLKNYYDYIKKQDEDGNLPPKIDKDILVKMLLTRHCPICDTKYLDDSHIEHVRKIEHSLAVASATSSVLNRALGSLSQYLGEANNYKSEKQKLIKELDKINTEIQKKELRIEELNKYIRTIPNEEKILKAIDEKLKLVELKDELIGKKAKEETILEANEKKLLEEKAKLEKLIKKHKELDTIKRQRDFCENCCKLMNESREEILNECRSKIQQETFEIFSRLIWKKDYFSGIIIHEDYSFELLDKYHNQCLGSCSAAETALLALSFTLALQDVSKHDALLFIDTPIGRVVNENRTNFMDTLMEISKEKQVILTFTPTEYDTNVQRMLSNNYSTFNHLTMNSDGITTKK